MTSKNFQPDWTEKAPASGTYRSIFKYGDPQHFKHPSAAWYRMMKQDFHLSDADFARKGKEGREPVVLNVRRRLNRIRLRPCKLLSAKKTSRWTITAASKTRPERPPRKCWNSARVLSMKWRMWLCILATRMMYSK